MVTPYKDKRTKAWRRRTTYSIWYSMVKRCTDPNHHGYSEYGGRGIRVHEEWVWSDTLLKPQAFTNFVNYIGLRPSQYVTLDRMEVNGHYEPGNVKWATGQEQGRNKRTTIFVEDPLNPPTLIKAADLADRMKITYQQLRYRLAKQGKWPTIITGDESQ